MIKFSLCITALNVSLAVALFTIKQIHFAKQFQGLEGFTLVTRRLWYKRGFRQVTGDLTRVR